MAKRGRSPSRSIALLHFLLCVSAPMLAAEPGLLIGKHAS